MNPFFITGRAGRLFGLEVASAERSWLKGGLLFVHPFAEEKNKSQRMAALQARMLAENGFVVLLLDLFGCGESEGDMAEASWDLWLEDLALGRAWLEERVRGPITLWGLRLGGLLAVDYAASAAGTFQGIVLWNPVLSGKTAMTQFLRLRVAASGLGQKPRETTAGLREAILAGKQVETAGYVLSSELLQAIDNCSLEQSVEGLSSPIHWMEVVPDQNGQPGPASRRLIASLQSKGLDISVHCVHGEPFWACQEIVTCRGLLNRTTEVFQEFC
ncbi:MAG: hydrolase 2, exosortase A system-associated [Desulfohalobiaceae bacterium]|nr:hydrolase 2, exosortase A system-associated [Desulfohalobiaceae bacterium]